MLHIDHNTQRYLVELDKNFTGTTPIMSHGILKEINKVFDDIEEDWNKQYTRVSKGVDSFNNKLVNALSDPLPSKYKSKRRPTNRKFPFMDKGGLVHSYNNPDVSRVWGNNIMTLTISPEFTDEAASLTNLGEKQRNSGAEVHWLRWSDRVFGDNIEIGARHSAKVPNIRDVLLGYYS